MPKKSKKAFKSNVRSIVCGMRLLDLPDNARVEVKWVSLVDEGEDLKQTTETQIESGGNSSAGVAWEPGGNLAKGQYMAVISVNGRKLRELPFTIE